jgi:hypothetical protein
VLKLGVHIQTTVLGKVVYVAGGGQTGICDVMFHVLQFVR